MNYFRNKNLQKKAESKLKENFIVLTDHINYYKGFNNTR